MIITFRIPVGNKSSFTGLPNFVGGSRPIFSMYLEIATEKGRAGKRIPFICGFLSSTVISCLILISHQLVYFLLLSQPLSLYLCIRLGRTAIKPRSLLPAVWSLGCIFARHANIFQTDADQIDLIFRVPSPLSPPTFSRPNLFNGLGYLGELSFFLSLELGTQSNPAARNCTSIAKMSYRCTATLQTQAVHSYRSVREAHTSMAAKCINCVPSPFPILC